MGVALLAPVLIGKFGLPEFGTHLFLLYFACMSAVTPPVAVACFAAGAIAGANPMAIGKIACRIAFAGFVLPFFFLFNEGVLARGPIGHILIQVLAAIVFLTLLAFAISGQSWRRSLHPAARLALGASAAAMVYPDAWSQAAVGSVGIALIVLLSRSVRPRREQTAVATEASQRG
jgi:TRAP-type uncharacterized transport system fused permease subunit